MLTKALLFAVAAVVGPPEIPEVEKPPVRESGLATTYGLGGFHGNRTAVGEIFRPKEEVTCAHKTLPLGTVVLVESGDGSIWCRINDRGPYVVEGEDGTTKAVGPGYELRDGEEWTRIFDMSVKASKELGRWGLFKVKLRYWAPARRAQGYHRESVQ